MQRLRTIRRDTLANEGIGTSCACSGVAVRPVANGQDLTHRR